MDFNSGHIDDEALENYSTRRMSQASTMHVERHLLICGACRERLVEAEEYITAIKDAARVSPRLERAAPQQRWWNFPRLIPAFAALVLIGIAVVALPLTRRGAAAPVAISLRTMRGPATENAGPSRRPLLLTLDLNGLATSPSYLVEMVDRNGDRVWRGAGNPSGASVSVTVPSQERGTYFVRVGLPSGKTLREYELELRGAD